MGDRDDRYAAADEILREATGHGLDYWREYHTARWIYLDGMRPDVGQRHRVPLADPAYGHGMTTEPEPEPSARTAGEQDHGDPETFRGDDANAPENAPQDPETPPLSS